MTASPPGHAPSCATLTRAMAIFLVLNAFVLSGVFWLVAPNGEVGSPPVALKETVLQHTWDLLHARGGDDSWGIISAALDYAQKPHTPPLYTEIFFNRQIKFQYPPTALFAVAGMRLIDPARIRLGDYYQGPMPSLDDMLGIAFIAMLALSTAALFELRLRQTQAFVDCHSLVAVRVLLVVAFALTFYPAVKAFTLGQIQVWINGLFALALLCWIAGRKATSGVLAGLICLIKPHYGIFLLWAALRREWGFAVACAVTGGIGLAVSIAVFGFADHIDYLRALSYMSQHGEGYYPNQSVNGLLNRLMSIAEPKLYANLEFFPDRFPPFNPWVYGGTMVAAAVILLAALFPNLPRLRGREWWGRDRTIDFCIMAVSATVASPIAWEHHYGILLPIFAVLLATAPASRGRLAWLMLSYVLASTFIPAANLLAPTVLNVAQSYLLAAAVILLVLLHTWPAPQHASRASM
jgi:alpha-1,2-mannosyltransferase